jgi:DNA-binding XRE family transcriptional regulator
MTILDGQKIKKLREEKKLSQFKLCLELNLSRQLISQIENNKRIATSLETAHKIAYFFGLKIEDLLIRKEPVYYD